MQRIALPHPSTRFPQFLHRLRLFTLITKPRALRPFTHNAQLLLLTRPVVRPQLPFLYATTQSSRLPKLTLQARVSRLLSTETKARWKHRFWWQLRFHAYFWPMLALGVVLYAGVHQTVLERRYPTPREWTFWSRWFLRSAKYTELDENARVERVLVDWMRVAMLYGSLLERLESEKLDGRNLIEQEEGGLWVDGVGRCGFDVSAKSEPWRRGYYEALIGAAKVGEHLEGMVRTKDRTDRRRNMAWAKDCIESPDNPRPKPAPWGRKRTPLPSFDEVEDAWPDPRVFYMRILTTKGFTNGQKVDAALAYADWLDFKGLHETAESMYNWALDIATGGLPVSAEGVVDMRTGVLDRTKTQYVSSNLLKATTALAVHHAQAGNVKAALPIFLSILQARKELPAEPEWVNYNKEKDKSEKQPEGLWTYYYVVKDWIQEPPYPLRPKDGDERPYHTLKEACEEVGIMTYVGEILYATSSQEKGLSWTRDAVDAAEAVMWVMKEQDEEEGREICRQCLATGLENWKKMAKSMAIEAEKREALARTDRSWLGGPSKREKAAKEARKWEEEETQIELRRQKTMPLIQPFKPAPTGWFTV